MQIVTARFLPTFAARRRATVLLMVVGMLAMLFVIITAYLTLARFERLTLQQVDGRRESRRVVDALNDLLRSYIREEITNNDGKVLGEFNPTKPYHFENLPGVGASRYLASLEPVLDASGMDLGDQQNNARYGQLATDATYGNLKNMRFPAVTMLLDDAGGGLLQPYIAELLWDKSEDGVINLSDLAGNSRDPFMDADGDGFPDSDFLALRLGTEIANTLAGRSVRVPDSSLFPPRFNLGPNDATVALWREFERSSKYTIAARVVSHGGMVALQAPGEAGSAFNGYSNVWNRRFVAGLFSELNMDRGGFDTSSSTAFYREIASNAEALEPLLRRRFLLPTWRPAGTNDALTAPALLRTLELDWPRTFAPDLLAGRGPARTEKWQRFSFVRDGSVPNRQTGRDWETYVGATYLDPHPYLEESSQTPGQALSTYDVRHIVTTMNHSDDLVRLTKERTGPVDRNLDPNADLRLPLGTTKFDLGLINRAFRADGTYNDDPITAQNRINGPAIVRRLAAYYYQMLSSHKDFPDLDTGQNGEEPRRREQSIMLAVNTVAAGAPRLLLNSGEEGGVTDVVYHSDFPTVGSEPVVYVGYGPQPFLTQVIAYNEATSSASNYEVALGVEIYNPNDPTDPGFDAHAMPVKWFAVSINDDFEAGVADALTILDPLRVGNLQSGGRLAGRTFAAFAVQTGNNSFFDAPFGGSHRVPSTSPTSGSRDIRVKLWRFSASGVAYKIDELEVRVPEGSGFDGDREWYVNAYRDCTVEQVDLFGDYGDPNRAARWRMVMDRVQDSAISGSSPSTERNELGNAAPQSGQFAPFIPLYVMSRSSDNADNAQSNPGYRVLNGTRRPTSFPTPGFLMFVPRYSHVRKLDTNGLPLSTSPTMGRILKHVWDEPGSGLSLSTYPADFGHMPLFDNRQAEEPNSYFSNSRGGRLPWGQLVFDYFTTLNLDDPNRDGDTSDRVDPLRVPSRVNINTAPWSVLAQLPVLNPSGLESLDPGLSPAFRSAAAGVLIGADALGAPRFAAEWLRNSQSTAFSDILRLGPHLAVSAAAYRDRIAYTDDVRGFLPNFVQERNTDGAYREAGIYGTIRAGAPNSSTNPRKTGFLSIGELLNVKGFDYDYLAGAAGAAQRRAGGSETLRDNGGDFFRAVGVLALLDTQFLTTRSNTFTVYLTVADRANAQASIRSQITVDRSNILPRAVFSNNDLDGDGFPDYVTTITSNALPQIVGQREIGYTNARYDD